jgi:hypothetical protein
VPVYVAKAQILQGWAVPWTQGQLLLQLQPPVSDISKACHCPCCSHFLSPLCSVPVECHRRDPYNSPNLTNWFHSTMTTNFGHRNSICEPSTSIQQEIQKFSIQPSYEPASQLQTQMLQLTPTKELNNKSKFRFYKESNLT